MHVKKYEENVDDFMEYRDRYKKKRRDKRLRDYKYKIRLKRIHEGSSGYPKNVELIEEKYDKNIGWVPIEKPYFKRFYRGNHGSKQSVYYKKVSNRCVRRYKKGLHNGAGYKRLFDYWYTLY